MTSLLGMGWTPPVGVRAAFTLRTGGVSQAPYDSFNLAAHVDDDTAAVATNRGLLRTTAGLPGEPAWLQQVHGAAVTLLAPTAGNAASAGDMAYAPPTADASVTTARDRVCAIQVADCLPVLLARRDGSAVAAAHAGWRGLAAGVLEATVAAICARQEPVLDGRQSQGGQPAAASDLVAWLGPAIGPAHFEVGDEVRAAFVDQAAAAARAFVRNSRGRWQCDLPMLARQRLAAVGVSDVAGGDWCTYADPARLYSYRRDGRCGRMAALIWRT